MLGQWEGLDLLLLAALAAFIVWEVLGIVRTRGKLKLKARVYGRYISLGLVVVLVAIALVRRGSQMSPINLWVLAGAVLLGSVLYVLVEAGFGEDGVYFNGRFTPFADLEYYNIERENERSFSLRLRSRRREIVLEFTPAEQPLVLAYMEKGKVPDFKTAMERRRSR